MTSVDHDRTQLVIDQENDDNREYSGSHDARYRDGPRHTFRINKGKTVMSLVTIISENLHAILSVYTIELNR